MPEKKRELSLLVYALLIVVFLALAILGSYVILNINADGPAGGHYESSGTDGSNFFVDGRSQENQSGLQYARNGSFSGIWNYSASSDPPENGSCLTLALVDYRLMPLYYNGSLANSYTLRYQTPISVNVSFNLTWLQEGFHNVLFLTVRNPYAEPLRIPGHEFPRVCGWILHAVQRDRGQRHQARRARMDWGRSRNMSRTGTLPAKTPRGTGHG